ncbi:MAG: glycosyltransferase [Acidobacteriota bacterium]|nr:glycosyltransferase [Blastocatellia bacterium]MDW8413460.1 glycosyltransferase [Acidobacteriota bacterium]
MIFAACKGLDERFDDYLEALFRIDYPDYAIIFVVESKQDPAVEVIERVRARYSNPPSKLVIAGCCVDGGQKVHNLLVALDYAENAEAYVYVDSDVIVGHEWLRQLIAPLQDETIGATTGYRWFVPTGSWTSMLRSAWNATIATAMDSGGFAWGGSMAILRKTFDRLGVAKRWLGALSDDYALSQAVKDAGLKIKFVPACVLPSYGEISFAELLEFTSRQIIITRVYAPKLWWMLLASTALFNCVFWAGWPIVAVSSNFLVAVQVLVWLLGCWKGYLRVCSLPFILPKDVATTVGKYGVWYILLPPVVSLLYLYNLLISLKTDTISWRGIRYKLVSASKTIVEVPEARLKNYYDKKQ